MTDIHPLLDAVPGTVLGGRYRLAEAIGEGGMARVFRADDLSLRRTVAIKVMRAPAEPGLAQERVRSETTLLASLAHPSLVTLYDAHISADEPSYLVMEYVEGPTLRDRLDRGGALRPDEVAALAVDLAEALHVVHAKGVVHRDIKPSNVLLWPSPLPDREFRAKLTDFGIAYLLDATRLTSPGTVIGTAAYLAPEQVRGDAPSTSADIYSLGLVLLESLTGRRAFGDSVGHEAIVARLAVAPDVPDHLPRAWRDLLTGMTSATPSDRPTALAVALAASALRERHPLPSRPAAAATDRSLTLPLSPTDAPTPAATPPGFPTPPPLPGAGADAATRTQVLVADAPDRLGTSAGASRRRTRVLTAAVVGLIVAIAVAVGVAVTVTERPAAAPTLPAVEEPLGTHLEELLEAVTP